MRPRHRKGIAVAVRCEPSHGKGKEVIYVYAFFGSRGHEHSDGVKLEFRFHFPASECESWQANRQVEIGQENGSKGRWSLNIEWGHSCKEGN